MNRRGTIRRTLLAVTLSAFGASTSAQIAEVEGPNGNNGVGFAQDINPEAGIDKVVVTGYIGRAGTNVKLPDIDFYKFNGKVGQTINIDISNAHNGNPSSVTNLDSYVTLFGPQKHGYPILREGDDAPCDLIADPASPCSKMEPAKTRDPRLPNVSLPYDGEYYLAVTPSTIKFTGGVFKPGPTPLSATSNGRYTLTITGLIPPVLVMNIAIKPGSGEAAPMNKKSQGNVPVALLGRKDAADPANNFDPFAINVNSLRFGMIGDEQSLRRCSNDPVDVNNDGVMDRVCHFDNQAAMEKWTPNDHEAKLTGQMTNGMAFEGTGTLKVLGVPKTDVE